MAFGELSCSDRFFYHGRISFHDRLNSGDNLSAAVASSGGGSDGSSDHEGFSAGD